MSSEKASFEIAVTLRFSAAHALRLAEGAIEPLHGHNWRVRVTVRAAKLDAIGVVMDFHELERRMEDVIGPMRNRNLNELAAFAEVNPSAENVAGHVARRLALPGDVKLVCVDVWETDDCRARWRIEELV